LLEKTVYQSGFTMVNVGDNGDVTKAFDHRFSTAGGI
jgi:hypothetical protein